MSVHKLVTEDSFPPEDANEDARSVKKVFLIGMVVSENVNMLV